MADDMTYDIDDAHLMEPFWASDVIYGESVLPIRAEDGAHASARLLFPPTEIICVENAAGTVTYVEGRATNEDIRTCSACTEGVCFGFASSARRAAVL